MDRFARSIILGVTTMLVVAGCSASGSGGPASAPVATAAPSAVAAAASPASADLLKDVALADGRTMHLLCVGPVDTGKPTVIFESGLGGDAGQWGDVLHEIQGTTRACAYDRAGDGQSPPATAPDGRTTKDQVTDLRELLSAAQIAPPYVLVGYSVGGWNVLVHADEHAADVVGAVLVDVRPPGVSDAWKAAMPAPTAGESEAITATRTDPDTFERDPSQNPEGLLLADSAAQAIAAKGLGDHPLVVLAGADTTEMTDGFTEPLASKVVDIWFGLQADLAKESTNGRLQKVDGAGHDLPFAKADVVADAIREVLGD